jgi:hypothetical protein
VAVAVPALHHPDAANDGGRPQAVLRARRPEPEDVVALLLLLLL